MITPHKHRAAFLSLLSLSLLIGWRPLFETLALSWKNDEYTHILLILPISVALIFIERRFLQTTKDWDFRWGPVLLAAALAIACSVWLWPIPLNGDVRLSIFMFALVLWWMGSFVLCFGVQAARSTLFSLLFLFGLVPLPAVALNGLISFLQSGSTWAAHGLFAAFGVPVVQDGFFLAIPGLTIQVAQECSSIRSSSMLLVTTLVLSQILLRSPWRKALVIGISVPLSIAKNGLRIFTIAMLAIRVDPGYLTGRLHHQGGILFFVISLICIFALLAILRKGDDLPLVSDLKLVKARAAVN